MKHLFCVSETVRSEVETNTKDDINTYTFLLIVVLLELKNNNYCRINVL